MTVTGTLSGTDYFTSCSPDNGGPEAFRSFTAPAAGVYTFVANRLSGGETVVVHDGSCAGAVLACDTGSGATSQVAVNLLAGQQVVVVVESTTWGGIQHFNLTIQ